jgi:large subunit ribosomal protein L24
VWQSSLQWCIKMKKEFSKSWKKSRQPRKQRKYLAKAPLSLRKKLVSASLSKELRKKYGKKNIPLRAGDDVKIMRGSFKKRTGKVSKIDLKKLKIIIEGIQIKKQDGSKANVGMQPSNLQIIELNLEDSKRKKALERKGRVQSDKSLLREENQSTKKTEKKK